MHEAQHGEYPSKGKPGLKSPHLLCFHSSRIKGPVHFNPNTMSTCWFSNNRRSFLSRCHRGNCVHHVGNNFEYLSLFNSRMTWSKQPKPTYTPWVPGGSKRPGQSSSWRGAKCHDDRTCQQSPRATAKHRLLHTQTAGTSSRSREQYLWRRLGKSCNSDWCRERWSWGRTRQTENGCVFSNRLQVGK